MQINRLTIDQRDNEDWNWLLIAGDTHLGEKAADVPCLKRDLARARELGARILMPGDVLGMIIPKDPRYKPAGVVPQIQGRDDLVNACLEYVLPILEPYADLFDMLSMGNHEASFVRHHSTDIIGLLVSELRANGSDRPVHGGYSGYLQYQIRLGGKERSGGKLYDIWYHHGSGGDAPVTKGMIDANRVRTQWIADLYVMGHNHYRNADPDQHVRLTTRGKLEVRENRFVRGGNYRKSYLLRDQTHPSDVDYTEEQRHSLKPLGGTFVKFRIRCHGSRKTLEQHAEV